MTTRDGYLDRIPKALILDAVREGAGTSAAARLIILNPQGTA